MGQNGHISDEAFFQLSAAIYGAVTIALALLAALFLENIWMVGDTKIFFRMAEVIVGGGVPYVDLQDPKPPLIFFTLALPLLAGQKLAGGILLVAIGNFFSALLTLRIGWKLYGRLPGLAAGLLLLLNLALAEGFFILTEPFTLLFILLSVYALLFARNELLAGACAGVAIGFKQYALLLVPLALYYYWRKGDMKRMLPFLAGTGIVLAAVFGAIFLYYGTDAGLSAVYWSFGVADSYVTNGYIGDIPAYKAEDPLVALANFGLGAGIFITLLAVAAAGLLLDRALPLPDRFIVLSAAAFLGTLAIRPYLHYWALALPFLALLCARAYRAEALK